MTDEVATNALVESSDAKASILAAIARIEAVPASKTLIDQIPDADWCSEGLNDWMIEVGSEDAPSEELDSCDKPTVKVA
ncbi:hypothetical protein [Sulfitobacter sp. 1A12157]|uniref:hypothetical protein n=1 Tax=Sulfitobacter sp. 1A12157 TaxID=3368594 RepID=UPI003744F9C8